MKGRENALQLRACLQLQDTVKETKTIAYYFNIIDFHQKLGNFKQGTRDIWQEKLFRELILSATLIF